jgi:hypothetical protein
MPSLKIYLAIPKRERQTRLKKKVVNKESIANFSTKPFVVSIEDALAEDFAEIFAY